MRFRLLTAATALSVWVLVAVGGVVRVTESGLGCPHWPLCTAGAVPLDRLTFGDRVQPPGRGRVGDPARQRRRRLGMADAALAARRALALVAAGLVPFQALLGATAVWLKLPGWVVALSPMKAGRAFFRVQFFRPEKVGLGQVQHSR